MLKGISQFFRYIGNAIRFNQLPKDQKKLVFYSEGKNYWIYLESLVENFLSISDTPVCFISSSDEDPGLLLLHPNYKTFVIGEGYVRDWFFANMDTQLMVMTMPDLNQYQVKKSKNKVHYVYVQHSLVSFHMVYRTGAFDYYDSIYCAGPHHLLEMKAIIEKYNLPPKSLIKHGYSRLDAIIEEAKKRPKKEKVDKAPIHVLVAPSWGPQGMIESGMGEQIVDHLLSNGFQVTLRPHPQTLKFAKGKVDLIAAKHTETSLFSSESNVVGQDSIQDSDIMICDWSGVAFDYAFGLEKPVLSIDLPRKVNNPKYEEIEIVPFEVYMRKSIGDVVPVNEIGSLTARINKIFDDQAAGHLSLSELRESNVFNVGRSGIVGAEELAALLESLPGNT